MSKFNIEELKSKHKLLKEFTYELKPVFRGYNNRTLYVNVSTNEIKIKDVPEEMKEKFIGGKGFALKLLWDAITPETRWDSEENEICIGMGPICGITNYPGSGKSLLCSISPLTGIPIDSNVGGFFGPYLKFSGFDAMEIQGKAAEEIIIYINGDEGKIQIFTAPQEETNSHILAEQLIEMFADNEEDKQHISTVSAGKGSDHTYIGCLNFSFYDKRRKATRLKQAGRGGLGTIFRNKKIKAIVVKYSNLTGNSNNCADIKKIREVGLKLHNEIIKYDKFQCHMREIGTAHLIEIMDEYDLLPVKNFRYGSHPDTKNISSKVFIDKFITQGMPDSCWYGCTLSCAKAADNFELKTGPYKSQKVIVDGPEYETAAGVGANCAIFDPHAILEINFYCDTYGIDTISFGTLVAFVMDCYDMGILDKEKTGGLELTWGNSEAALELLHQMAEGKGFGVIAGKGVRFMKKYFAEHFGADINFLNDIGMEGKGLEQSQYQSKESLAQQGGYYMTNKGPQHDEAWLIFMDMVNKQIPTFEDKAEALHYFPMFRTWFGLQGLCKLPWNDIEPYDNQTKYSGIEAAKVPEHVQNYVDLFNAVTGKNIDKEELIRQSERVYNFQRIFNLRMGYGKREHDYPPYRALGPVTEEEYESRKERYDKQLKEILGINPEEKTTQEKIQILRKYKEEQYEKLMDAVYKRRGWTLDGVPTIEHLKKIGMALPQLIEIIKPYQN